MLQNTQELVIIGNILLVKVSNWSIIMSNKRKRLLSQVFQNGIPTTSLKINMEML